MAAVLAGGVTRAGRRIAGGLLLGLAVLVVVAGAAGYFDRNPRHAFAATGPRAGMTALYVSGDMGLRFGSVPATIEALTASGVSVLGFNSSTLFRAHRTSAETDAIVARAVRDAARAAGGDRLVLIGQSFGADVLQTGLSALPADLRRRITAVILIVPGRDVYFRADPTTLAYRGAPDSDARATLRALDWVPLTCIYGIAESDSACPGLTSHNAIVVPLPGGHFLNHDSTALIDRIFAALRRARHSPTVG